MSSFNDLDGHSFWVGVGAVVLVLMLAVSVASIAYEAGRTAGLTECEAAVRSVHP